MPNTLSYGMILVNFCNPTSVFVTELRNSRQLHVLQVWLDWEMKCVGVLSLELLATVEQP